MAQVDPRIEVLRAMRTRAMGGGGQDKIDRQHAKGKLTARERLTCCWTRAVLPN
jgi:acetyl-CoA carboxylase carboxyltransferase component